ncbi:MAG: pfkB family kinase [Rhodoglobus sp.]|nr:pfkB family kinase [Rhodoglobus sp.]
MSSTSPTASATAHVDPLVAVVGSVNLDIVLLTDSVPHPGETVLGSGVSEHGGGKGGNQALAAARLAPTVFIGAVGADAVGDSLLENLTANGVGVSKVRRDRAVSGRAYITLTPDAENSIVVVPGANSSLTASGTTAALESCQPRVVIAQQEIPAEAVEAAAAWCEANARRFLLNASPVGAIDRSVLAASDPIIVNADEARDILGNSATQAVDAEAELAEQLLKIARSAIVTAGKRGAYIASRDGGVEHVAAEVVTAVDTTGAGDEFAGTVAASLALGESLREAAVRATAASGRLVQLARADR